MAPVNVDCLDFLEFQVSLQKMREMDDKIIYMLNTSLPTESFKTEVNPVLRCKALFHDIETGHSQREAAIQKCLKAAKERVQALKSQRDSENNNPEVLKHLRKEQNTLRLLQSELNVEEVVRKRTIQAYYEKCRGFYKPSHINSFA